MWNDVSACLKGDFAGIGTNQILMFMNEGLSRVSFIAVESSYLSISREHSRLFPDRKQYFESV